MLSWPDNCTQYLLELLVATFSLSGDQYHVIRLIRCLRWKTGIIKLSFTIPIRSIVPRYLLYGHLGGVVYLATNILGDMLVSVGQDKVTKVWRLTPGHTSPVLSPATWLSLNYNISAVTLSSDSSRLLVSLANRIQEVEISDRDVTLHIFTYLYLCP